MRNVRRRKWITAAVFGSAVVICLTLVACSAGGAGKEVSGATGAGSAGTRLPATITPRTGSLKEKNPQSDNAEAPPVPQAPGVPQAPEAPQVPQTPLALTGEPIRIGAIYALSGNNAAIGTNILRGIDFAAEDINQAGGVGGRPIEIIRGDTQGDAEVARAEAKRLITHEKVQAIVGCHQSTLTEIVSNVCEEYKIPMITAISTVDSISTHNNDYFFRLCPMNSLYLEDMFLYMKEQKEQTGKAVRTIAVFADNSMIGQEAIRCARIYAPRYGMEIVKEIQYRQGVADLTKEILELKEADADVVLAESYVADASLLMKTMKEQNYQPPMLIAKANGFADPSFIPATKGMSEGVTSVVEWNPDMTKGQEVNRRFKEIFGVDMNGHSAEAYTAIWTFKTAFEQARTDDGEAVKDALAAIDIRDAFPGGPEIILPYGRIKFEDYEFDGVRHYNNNIYASVAIAQIQDGEYRTVWPFEYSNQKIVYPGGKP
ncbi:MAG: ABC transporter substrate-binding protein [Lachnospiraceae bacterium]|nr:ABC transporter substrate-binding protein [Lachnospiraceae bacterium]